MADIWSIISSNYTTVGLNALQATGKYVNVDPTSYQGNWSGKYADNSSFNFQISGVSGFRAKVKYQSGSTIQYQDVLIKNGSFRIGNSKFTLQPDGRAEVKTVVTDPATGGNTLNTAYPTRS
jgi:hypothetical protein